MMEEKYNKPFDEWHPVKKGVHERTKNILFKEREIWWCHVGVNIGVEIDGKHAIFTRPVLVLHKFSSKAFFGIPLTGQEKQGTWYVSVKVKERISWAALNQARSSDSRRLRSRITQQMDEIEFTKIKQKFKELLSL